MLPKLLLTLLSTVVAYKSYQNDKVYQIPDNDAFDINVQWFLFTWLGHENIDIWGTVDGYHRVHVNSLVVNVFEKFLIEDLIEYEVVIDDLDAVITESLPQKTLRNQPNSAVDFDYTTYHNFEEVNGWMDLIRFTYPDMIDVQDVGYTFEGRKIRALKIFNPDKDVQASINQSFLFLSGQHAREWLAPASTMLVIKKLLGNYKDGDVDAKLIIDNLNIYFIPMMNADGYSYSFTNDRLWRKSRTVHPGNENTGCVGTDTNRNWASDMWGASSGADPDPCSNTYYGPEPLSEPCTKATSEWVENIQNSKAPIVQFQDVHTYSQLWMFPLGENCTQQVYNYDVQLDIGKEASTKIKEKHSLESFKYGSICETIYPSTGCAVDYFFQKLNVPCSTTVELRDTGYYGFLMPQRFIEPAAEEMYDGYVAQMLRAGECVAETF